MKNFQELLEYAKLKNRMTLAVAAAQDAEVLIAVDDARKLGLINGILVGDENKIKDTADMCNIDISKYVIIDEKDTLSCAKKSVELVSSDNANFLMKGLINTADLLRAVLDKNTGLRTNNLLSHVMVYNLPDCHKFLLLTDGGMVTYPDLEQKVQIIQNAVKAAKAMGISQIKVIPLCPDDETGTETSSFTDSVLLVKMNYEGIIKECVVEGPLPLDKAIMTEADILLVPNIEAGNLLGKSFTYFLGAKPAGLIMGAKCPIVLTSRADSHESKLYSIALGSIVAEYEKSGGIY